jgi:prepilin-type N-terminal cleavage/methylation domain-containing protein
VREQTAERGFTLVELMMVVAVIAVLAVIVVPMFTSESKKAKGKSEINPMFAELANREDQYKMETGSYLPAAACPSSASSTGTDVISACLGTGTDWTNLRVQPSEKKLKCSYTVTTGLSTDDPIAVLPSWVTSLPAATAVSAPSLATSWYFIEAVCPDHKYFQASWDTKIRSEDGH